ncbi:MAG: MBL fold metallo-hydrolase [Lachnospirales bacterium]
MKVLKVNITCYAENAYIYYDENTLKAVLIDIGRDTDELQEIIKNKELEVVGILLTHGHYDHIGGVLTCKERYDAKIYAHEEEVQVTSDPLVNLSSMRMRVPIAFEPDVILKDGEVIDFDTFKLKCIHTKGHTAGSSCFYDEENKVVFTGDTLFYNVYGRVDLPTSTNDIKKSITEKLFTLPTDTVAYCGHGEDTTIGYEKTNNYIKSFIE